MEGYYWEGLEDEMHLHMWRCKSHVELEEIHPSLGELAQPFPLSLGMGGDLSMSYSTYMSRAYGNDIGYLHSYIVCMLPLTISVQDVAPRRSILFPRLHGSLETMSMIGDHPLGRLGEELCVGWHAHFVSYIIHFLQTHEENGAVHRWLENHILIHSLL